MDPPIKITSKVVITYIYIYTYIASNPILKTLIQRPKEAHY